MKTHSGETPHICSTCGKGFKQKYLLTVHLRVHTGERPHVCWACNKSYTQSSALAKHMLTHSDENLNTCPTSGKSFEQKGHLTGNITLHSAASPDSTHIEGKSFSETNLNSGHMKIHQSHGESFISSSTETLILEAPSTSALTRTCNQNDTTRQGTWNKSRYFGIHTAEDPIVIHIKTEEEI